MNNLVIFGGIRRSWQKTLTPKKAIIHTYLVNDDIKVSEDQVEQLMKAFAAADKVKPKEICICIVLGNKWKVVGQYRLQRMLCSTYISTA